MKPDDPIIIVPYDPQWPNQAAREMEVISKALDNIPIVDIQHAGSTSIPKANAKPIIDLYIGVSNVEKYKDQIVQKLESLNYIFWYDNPDPTHLFFVKGMPPHGEKRTHHIHVIKHGDTYWHQHMVFRDYLTQHPEALDAYNLLKNQLAVQFTNDREAYTQAKTDFIMGILKKAGVL